MSHDQKKSAKALGKILRARSGAQVSAAEANRLKALMRKGFKPPSTKGRKLSKSLSRNRGVMGPGGLSLGRGLGRKTGHKERGRIGLKGR